MPRHKYLIISEKLSYLLVFKLFKSNSIEPNFSTYFFCNWPWIRALCDFYVFEILFSERGFHDIDKEKLNRIEFYSTQDFINFFTSEKWLTLLESCPSTSLKVKKSSAITAFAKELLFFLRNFLFLPFPRIAPGFYLRNLRLFFSIFFEIIKRSEKVISFNAANFINKKFEQPIYSSIDFDFDARGIEVFELAESLQPLLLKREVLYRCLKILARLTFPFPFAFNHPDAYWDISNAQRAYRSEQGVLTFGVQHGGGYGSFFYFSTAYEIEMVASEFLTWGWSADRLCGMAVRCYPHQNMRFGTRFGRHHRFSHDYPGKMARTNSVVLIGANLNEFDVRVDSRPHREEVGKYHARKRDALHALAARGFEVFNCPSIWDRKYINQGLENYFKEISYDVLSEDRSDFMFVVDAPTTIFFEILASGEMLVCSWDLDIWVPSDRFGIAVQKLRSAGIFFDSVKCSSFPKSVKAFRDHFYSVECQETLREVRIEWARINGVD